MEHLALEVFDLATTENPNPTGSQYAVLEPNATITITDTSDIFADGDVWSYDFKLNVHANAHLFGTAGDIHGSRLHEQINKRKARLWVEGVPLYLGYLKLGDEAEVDAEGNVDVSFESGQKTFEEMTEGAKANQVPMMGDVRFGVALWRKRWTCVNVKLEASAVFKDKSTSLSSVITHTVDPKEVGDEDPQFTNFSIDGEQDGTAVQQYPRMVFPKGKFDNLKTDVDDDDIDCLNTDTPYDDSHPYCNVALCYQKYGYDKKQKDGSLEPDYSSEPEAQRGYEVMPANRVNSAPNFFVIYWVRALMKHLGIYVEENQMMDVEDLRRLFFVNTNCAYKEPKYLRDPQKYDWSLGKYQLGSGGDIVPEYFGEKKNGKYNGPQKMIKPDDCGFTSSGITVGSPFYDHTDIDPADISAIDRKISNLEVERIVVKVTKIAGMSDYVRAYYDGYGGNKLLAKNRYLHDAIATSDCFPNVDISEVVSALESGFGVRLLFSNDYKRVRIVLLRNVFRNEEVQDIACEIADNDVKVENNIRGFRMTYGDSEDTSFYYKGFADLLPHKKELWADNSDSHDYSQWKLDASYSGLIHNVSAFDKTCYVDPTTGDAYIIKVDKDAKRYDDLHPSLFGCADFMDAEDGDCTGGEDTIKTINVGFTPAIMNDTNFEQEREGYSEDQKFALFVDATMRPRRPDLKDKVAPASYDDSDAVYSVDKLYEMHGPSSKKMMTSDDGIVKPGEFAITSDMSPTRKNGLSLNLTSRVLLEKQGEYPEGGGDYTYYVSYDIHWPVTFNISGHINEGYRLYLQDNFEPNDEGISPIETKDWGLTLGIMRGSGSDAYVNYTDDPDDGEGNSTWDIMAGSSVTAHPDTCDSYGNEWDYNGSIFVNGGGTAIEQMQRLWPNSNINLVYSSGTTLRDRNTYINSAVIQTVSDNLGNSTALLFATTLGGNGQTVLYTGKINDYKKKFEGMTTAQMYAFDASSSGFGILIEVGSSTERMRTLLELQKRAFVYGDTSSDPMILDSNGIGSRYGRFSLKLRAEKPNPYFDPKQPESDSNRRYLEITNPNLQQRGLCDQFYKEYSYWIRNARIVKRTVRMTLAQLLTIDKAKRVRVGDVTGFIRKMQYSVSNETGLGNVILEIMYI